MVSSPVHLVVVGKAKPGFDMDARMFERYGGADYVIVLV